MIDRNFYTLGTPMTLGDLAARLNSSLPTTGAAEEFISSFSALGDSCSGDLTFLSDQRHKSQLETANATACLTTRSLFSIVAETGMIAIICANPRAAFAKLSGEMVGHGSPSSSSTTIHETAVIHTTAVIGSGVSIGANTQIGANTVIDDGVQIGANCIIEPLVRISFSHVGNGCHFKSGAIIGGAGFGMVSGENGVFAVPHIGRVMIGNDVHIGSSTCIDRGQLGDTEISNGVKIDNLVQIGHNTKVGEGAMIAGHSGISGSCVIGKNVLLGGRSSLSDHVTIGDGASLAGNSFAMADVPAGKVYFGSPALPIREHMRNLITLKKLAKRK